MSFEPYRLVTYDYATRNKFQIEQGYHPFHSLYIIQSGSFVCKSGGVSSTYKSGDVVFFPPDMEFNRHILEPLVFHFILFEPSENSQFPFTLPAGKLEFGDRDRLQATLQAFHRIASLHDSDFDSIRQHLLNDIIYQYYIETQTAPVYTDREFDDAILLATVNYMKKNISSKLNLNQLSRLVGITPSGLIWKFKTKLGTTPIEYLISLRVRLAKQLLSETNLPIQDIAQKCGFENSYYFSNFFKKHTGLSPSFYRKANLI